MSLQRQAERLVETDIALKRFAGVLGTSGGASYDRLLLLSDEKPKRAETIARLADEKAQEDLILASINAAIASGYLDRDDTKRQRLKEAEELIDQELAERAPTANLIVLKATIICLKEGAMPASSFLRSRRAALAEFQRANALGFINQGYCARRDCGSFQRSQTPKESPALGRGACSCATRPTSRQTADRHR